MDREMQEKVTKVEKALKEIVLVIQKNDLSVEEVELLTGLIEKISKTESRICIEPRELNLIYTESKELSCIYYKAN